MPHEVLHVIQRFSGGGASRALLALIDGTESTEHRVVSLVKADSFSRDQLARREIALVEHPSSPALDKMVESADIVQVHFWNTPELYDFMSKALYGRVIVWSLVAGHTDPHVVTAEVASYADRLVASGRPLVGLCDRQLVIAPRSPHVIDLKEPARRGLGHFTVGIFGTLDSSKSDPTALDVFVDANLPRAKLLVVGSGDLPPIWMARAKALGLEQRVEFTGFVRDVGLQLARMDVLLHMPSDDSFGTLDLSLQEAMAAGVVPVVRAGTPASDLVRDDVDGLIADNNHDYVSHLRSLYHDPQRVERLRNTGVQRSRTEFTPQSSGAQFEKLYSELYSESPRIHQLPASNITDGAQRFITTLGPAAHSFRISARRGSGWREADNAIALSPPALVGPGAGGILHYRGYYPKDPILRYWAGLVFAAQGRPAFAAAEFAASAKAGWPGAEERLRALIASGPLINSSDRYQSDLQAKTVPVRLEGIQWTP
jgi:glycosyltransferase involved in cell wall biosynthesis